MHTYDLTLRAQDRVDAYHLVDANGMAWATAYVDDVRGTLAIVSDWGEFAYRWNARGFGAETPSLTEFLAGRTYFDYLVDKLLGARAEEFSAERTIANFRAMIVEKRRHQSGRRPLDKETARELWNEIGELDGARDYHEFHDGLPEVIHEHFGDLHEEARDEPTREALALNDLILPALMPHLGAECERRRARAAAAGAMVHALGAWAVACDVREPLRLLHEERHALLAKRRDPGLEPEECDRLDVVLATIDDLERRERGPHRAGDALAMVAQAVTGMFGIKLLEDREAAALAEVARLEAALARAETEMRCLWTHLWQLAYGGEFAAWMKGDVGERYNFAAGREYQEAVDAYAAYLASPTGYPGFDALVAERDGFRAEAMRLKAELVKVLGVEPPGPAPMATNLADATIALLQAGQVIGALEVADRLAPGALSPWLTRELRTAHRWIRRVLPNAHPSKHRLVNELLLDGEAVNLRVNGKYPGVSLPAHLAELPAVDLLIGRRLSPPLADLALDDYQITATFAFPGGLSWPCVIPWGAVYAACPLAEGARTMTWPEAFPAELATTPDLTVC